MMSRPAKNACKNQIFKKPSPFSRKKEGLSGKKYPKSALFFLPKNKRQPPQGRYSGSGLDLLSAPSRHM
jgi:hypothetical protein